VIAGKIGARHLRVAGYYPHTQQPDLVNAALRDFWQET
jgi:hypothetical protein